MNKLKSVHITNYYHKNSGGISTVYNGLLDQANRRERQISLIVPGERNDQEKVGDFGKIHYVKAAKSPIFDRRYRMMMPWKYILSGSQIRRILLSEMPDIIEIAEKYTLSYLAGLIKKGYFKSINRPMLVHLSCERMDDNLRAFISGTKPFRWLARRFMGNYIAPMFDYHLANSDYTAQELLDSVPPDGISHRAPFFSDFCWRFFRNSGERFSERVFVNNCGVEDEVFNINRKNPETRRRILSEMNFPANAKILLYAGRLSPEKNIKLLFKVFRGLIGFYNYDLAKRDFRLLIAGDGPQSNWLRKKLQKYAPGKFKFLGHIAEKEKLADIYANSDVFFHTNPREPFGIAPLEAMASGTPVIVPNSGGVLSYANNENAWVEEPLFEDYFSALMDIFNHPEERERKVENALETARQFTWEKSFERLFKLYDELYEEFLVARESFGFEGTSWLLQRQEKISRLDGEAARITSEGRD
ncbi:MAG: glycosyltransferase [Pyrinomonadaceae bacterium]